MKNKFNVILACLWLLIGVFFGWILFSKLINGSSFSGNGGITISLGDLSAGDIKTLYKTYSFNTSEITDFDVSSVSESVHFQPFTGNEYVVELYGNWNESLEPEVTEERNTLKIKCPSLRLTNLRSLGSRKIVINVPESECTKLFNAEVSTVSGSVHTAYISFREFDADTTSGSIHTDGYIVALSANSVSGSIHVNGICENSQCDTVSGSIHFVTDNPLTGRNRFNSVSGSIHVTIPEGTGFEFEWNTVSGSVSNAFYNGKCGKTGSQIVGDGMTLIHADTTSGSIHLNKN